MVLQLIGKYDTYKGSTLSLTWNKVFRYELGNMILIKDRHEHLMVFQEFAQCGKYDTYKGSTLVNWRQFSTFWTWEI